MLRLVSIFSDGAMLQQKAVTDFRGYGEKGSEIVGTLIQNNTPLRSARAIVDEEGHFTLSLPGEEASFDPYEVTFTDGIETVTLHNILFGDVWLAAGQSNMEMRNSAIETQKDMLAKTATLPFRGYTFDMASLPDLEQGAFPRVPAYDIPGAWCASSDPGAFAGCSAAATAALVRVYEALEKQGRAIPMAILCLNRGGTSIETWLPKESLDQDPALVELLRETGHYTEDENWNVRSSTGRNLNQQTALFNTIMAPALGMKTRGMLWYQGENNVDENRATESCYQRALEALYQAYAPLFAGDSHQPYPMICSLLFPWTYGESAAVRRGYINAAIVRTAARHMGSVAVAPIYDLPATWAHAFHYHPIHPSNKYAVGNRLGGLMLTCAYGETGLPTAAYFKKMTRKKGALLLRFETFRRSLTVKGEKLKGFYISGKNGTFIPAEAQLVARNAVLVKSPYVTAPSAVCYQFADFQCDGNLYCGELPVAPFTTVEGRTPLTVALKPWLEAETPSLFHRLPGSDANVFAYPVRYPVGGSALCYDPHFHAIRLLCAEGQTTCGMEVRSEETMPLDLHLYREIRFPVYGRTETKISLRLTLREGDTVKVRTCPVSFTTVRESGVLQCRAVFRVRPETVVEKMAFLFDTDGTGYPTVAIGDFALIPKK